MTWSVLIAILLAKHSPASPRLKELAHAVGAGQASAVERFWETVTKDGAPLIEPVAGSEEALVTFLYQGDATTRNVVLSGGPRMSLQPNDNRLTLLPGTNVWYRTYRVRRDARFTYKLGVDADTTTIDIKDMAKAMKRFASTRLDPLNPRRFPLTTGIPDLYVSSVVELPLAPKQPWVVRGTGPAGAVDSAKLTSAIMGNERWLSVYTPPGYERGKGPYRLLVVFDREAYLGLVPTPVILDNLIDAGRIPPHVAVLVSNPGNTRNAELPCNRKFIDFLATELVPWVRDRYAVAATPDRVTLAGSSYGGLASTCAALFHPEVFGNVLSQSGSFWWPDSTAERHEWIYRQFEAAPKLPIRFYQDVGLMEDQPTPGGGPSMVGANRKLRDLLRSKGYEVHYAEFDGGHEYLNWQGTLADGLLALHGRP